MIASQPTSVDPRTAKTKLVDELASQGDWSGFHETTLLSQGDADRLLDYREKLDGMLGGIKSQPFRWQSKIFRLLRCEYEAGQAAVEVAPHDDEFVAVLKKRIEDDRFHTLTYFQGFGFICLPEDYQKYQDR